MLEASYVGVMHGKTNVWVLEYIKLEWTLDSRATCLVILDTG